MSQNAERTLVQWAESWSKGDIDALLAIFTEDCIYEDVTFGVINRGKRALRAFADGMWTSFPDLDVKLTSHFVAGPWGAMEWVMSGTQKGDMPAMPASGKHFSLRGASVLELEGAKIRRISDYFDLTALLKQLGFMPQ